MTDTFDRSLSVPSFSAAAGDILSQLDTTLGTGLSEEEARRRLETYGPNELRGKRPTPFLVYVLRQMRSVLILILVAAVAVSIWVGDWIEAFVILAIVVLNALVGAIQERKAEQALHSLRTLAAPNARVLRDGKARSIPASTLVPGDIVTLDAGSIVPADLRLIETARLQVEESALTGESSPVVKNSGAVLESGTPLADRVNCAWAGTKVTYGRATAVVTETGQTTQVGRIAALLEEEDDPPPLQRKLERFGRTMGLAVVSVCVLLFVVGLLRSADLSALLSAGGFRAFWASQRTAVTGLFIVAVSLAVAAVPEGLPAVVTLTLAVGTQKMLRRNALVRRLPSVETLGAATVICTDKTGTLTRNRMTVTEAWTASGTTTWVFQPPGDRPAIARQGHPVSLQDAPDLRALLVGGAACNDAERDAEGGIIGDPTEGALLRAAWTAGLAAEDRPKRVGEIPFDSSRKRMTTIHASRDLSELGAEEAPYVAVTKGAVDGLLPLCRLLQHGEAVSPLTPARLSEITSIHQNMGKRGLRVLAVAYRTLDDVAGEPDPETVETDLTFLGFVAMQDPPRAEVADAVATAKTAGLRTIMVTGDHATTAAAIARQIGILRSDGRVLDGTELDALSDEALRKEIEHIDVFARVSPQHKVRIVEALRAQGHIVAMTGDGVNDAPALKRSDIGIAMGIAGTDVAKDAADMVLVDDNYASIVAAIEQGRVIYENIRKTVFYLLSCNFAEIAILFVATLLGWPPPLTAIQLLWLNLATDGAPALALAMESAEAGIMSRPPRPPGEPIVNRRMVRGFLIQSSALAASILVIFALALRGVVPAQASTVAFATVVLAELFRAYAVRSDRITIVKLGWRSNRWMQRAVASSAVLLFLVLYVPPVRVLFGLDILPVGAWLWMVPFALVPMLATEARKALQRLA